MIFGGTDTAILPAVVAQCTVQYPLAVRKYTPPLNCNAQVHARVLIETFLLLRLRSDSELDVLFHGIVTFGPLIFASHDTLQLQIRACVRQGPSTYLRHLIGIDTSLPSLHFSPSFEFPVGPPYVCLFLRL